MNDERSEGLMTLKRLTATDLSEVNPYIEGRAVPSRSGGRFATIDPSNGTRLQDIPVGSDDDVAQAVRWAGRAFKDGVWHAMSPGSKHDVLCKWAALIEASASRLDALDALEMGKPIRVAAFN